MKIAYMHIPKTGGTTFKEILYQNYKEKPVALLLGKEKLDFFSSLNDHEKLKYDIVTGHFNYSFASDLPDDFNLFSLIRDPVQRVISHYNFAMIHSSHSNTDIQKEKIGFDKYLLSASEGAFNYLVYYFAGQHISNLSDALIEAQKNLNRFKFVGILELFDISLCYLKRKYKWNISYKQYMKTPYKTVETLTPAQEKFLLEKTWADQILYKTALSKLINQMLYETD